MTLFGALEPSVTAMAPFERVTLDGTSWADVVRELLVGADTLFDTLVQQLPFTQSRRLMYDRWVDEPRLSCGLDFGDAPTVVRTLAKVFGATYGVEFDSCFVNYYRDGHDSVTWHSDRIGRSILDPMVAIVSLGGPRRFGLRPKGGGPRTPSRSIQATHSSWVAPANTTSNIAYPRWPTPAPRMSLSFRHH